MPRVQGRAALVDMTMLVVDGHPDTRDMVVEYADLCGAKVISTGTAAEALVVLGAFRVDVVVVQAATLEPEDPGLALVARMQMHPAWRVVPCVFVSPDAPPRSLVAGLRRVVLLRQPIELDAIVRAAIDVGAA
ncbi:hypothetical protein [Sandaracinus amylolyticus]|uniref:hypothetical protein n=1 Tax=Sandaracinus amylolyticus TaxID=927083 RepID=UPI0012ED2A24|nr:hypothetical protein [Sandaracinus amylolyticus]